MKFPIYYYILNISQYSIFNIALRKVIYWINCCFWLHHVVVWSTWTKTTERKKDLFSLQFSKNAVHHSTEGMGVETECLVSDESATRAWRGSRAMQATDSSLPSTTTLHTQWSTSSKTLLPTSSRSSPDSTNSWWPSAQTWPYGGHHLVKPKWVVFSHSVQYVIFFFERLFVLSHQFF